MNNMTNQTEPSLNEFYEKYKQKKGVCGSINGVKALELAQKFPNKKIRLVGYNFIKADGSPFRHVVILYGNKMMDMSNMGYGGKPIIMNYMDFMVQVEKRCGCLPYIMDDEPCYLYQREINKIMGSDERYDTNLKYLINCGIDMGNSMLARLLQKTPKRGKCWAEGIDEFVASAETKKLEKMWNEMGTNTLLVSL
jgi:hypothetical protein